MASSWLSRAASMAQAAQEAAKEAAEKAAKEAAKLREEAQAAASGLAQGAERLLQLPVETKPSTVDLLFEDGPLGFELEGPRVVAVTEEGQAQRLGLCPGARLVAVNGEKIPAPPAEDSPATGDARVKRLIRKWIQGKSRPISLTFEHPDGAPQGRTTTATATAPGSESDVVTKPGPGEAEDASNAVEGCEPDLAPADLLQEATDGWDDALDLDIPQETSAMSADMYDEAAEAAGQASLLDAVEEAAAASADVAKVAPPEPEHEESAVLLDTMAKDEPLAEQAAPEDAADLLGELAVDQPLEQDTGTAAAAVPEEAAAASADVAKVAPPAPEHEAAPEDAADLLGELVVNKPPEQDTGTASAAVQEVPAADVTMNVASKPPPPPLPPSKAQTELDEELRTKQDELESVKRAAQCRLEEITQKAKERYDQVLAEHEKERQAFQSNLQKLQKSSDDAKTQGKKLSEQLKTAEDQLATAQAEVRQQVKQLKKSEEECQKLAAKLEKESAKSADLKQNMEQVIKDAKERDEARMREIKQLRDRSENELKSLREKSDSSSKDAETLRQRQLEEASMELKELHSESAQQKEMLSELVRESSAEAAQLRERLGAAEAAMEAEGLRAEERHTELEAGLSRSRQELRAANERGRRAEREVEQAHAECQELLSSATQRDDRVEVAQALLESRVRSLQEQVEMLRADLEEARASEIMKAQEAQAAQARCEDLSSSSQKKEQEWQEATSNLEQRVQSLQDELRQCRRGSVNSEVEHRDELLAAQRKAEESSQKAEEAEGLAQRLHLEASEVRSHLEASEAQSASWSSELAELKEARQQLSQKAAEATASCESHKQLIRALQQSMAEQSQKAEVELSDLRRQLSDATPTIQRALSSSTPQRKSSAGEWRALLEEEGDETDEKAISPSETPAETADQELALKPEVVGNVTDSLLDQLESSSALASGRLPSKGAGAPETAGHEEVAQLWDRINYLEKRCRNFQKKLDARPIIYQAPTGTGPLNLENGSTAATGKANWEPWLRDVTGLMARRLHLPQGSEQRVAAVAAPLCQAIEAPLRSFTQRLLRQDRWLWVFYAHLLVLYAIAASCVARSSNPVSPAECVDARLKQLQAAKDASAAAAGAG